MIVSFRECNANRTDRDATIIIFYVFLMFHFPFSTFFDKRKLLFIIKTHVSFAIFSSDYNLFLFFRFVSTCVCVFGAGIVVVAGSFACISIFFGYYSLVRSFFSAFASFASWIFLLVHFIVNITTRVCAD